MPIVNISLRKGTTAAHREQIADSVHRAMNTALATPKDDFFAVTQELEPENLHFDANYFGLERSNAFVIVQLFFNDRPTVVKERLFAAIVDNLTESPGLRREDIMLNISEVAPENWWLEGRQIDPATGADARMSAG